MNKVSIDDHNKVFSKTIIIIIITLVNTRDILLNRPLIVKMYIEYTERHEDIFFVFKAQFYIRNTEAERQRKKK